jgi:hypothetical protein
MVWRAAGRFLPWLGFCLVAYSCVEQSDAPPLGTAGKGGSGSGGTSGRAQSGSGGPAQSGSGATDAAGAGATGAPGGGTGASGRAGNAGRGGSAGSTGSSGSSPGGGGQTSGHVEVGRCDSPERWSANLEGCGGDFVHRPTAGACEHPPRNGEAGGAGMGPVNPSGSCDTDADCGPNSYCIAGRADNSHCVYGCREDADCGSGELCACVPARDDNTEIGTCVPADCSVDADCGPNSLCVSGLGLICRQGNRWWPSHFHCQSREDSCAGTADCGEGGRGEYPEQMSCEYSIRAKHFVCSSEQPGC